MMYLYSDSTCPFSQRCRHILFEKGMDFEIREVDLFNKPENIMAMNPYGQVPILVERDLILYESNIINEYIDARFPHPQLMPGDPMQCARSRLLLFNLERELFIYVSELEANKRSFGLLKTAGFDKAADGSKSNEENALRDDIQTADEKNKTARDAIHDRLTQLAPVFFKSKYMLGDTLTIVDIAIAPLLWRLEHYGIELPKIAAPLKTYAERIFSRPAFIDALTPAEKAMRR